MPVILIVLGCFLVGSLYVTGLEGIVDWIHRKLVHTYPNHNGGRIRRRVLRALVPFSDAARSRLTIEAKRFFAEFTRTTTDDEARKAENDFVEKVFADILWMEGKLAGTPLKAPYDAYRSEGELRLGTALILPLSAAAAGYATHLAWGWLAAVIALSIAFAIKLGGYGLYYYRRAHSFAAHHIADGVLLAPCMETLKRTSDQVRGEENGLEMVIEELTS